MIPTLAVLVVGSYAALAWFSPSPPQNACTPAGGGGSFRGLIYNQLKAPPSALLVPAGCTAMLGGYIVWNGGNLSVRPLVWYVVNATSENVVQTSSVTIQTQPSFIYNSSALVNSSLSFVVHAARNATGFYFVGIFGNICPGFWLAVGNSPSQVSLSKWPGGAIPFRGCGPILGTFEPTRVVNASLVTIYSG